MTRKILFAFIACVFLISGCAAAQMPADIISGAKDYPHEIAAAKKAGLPLSMVDLARPLPPADQNAATYYAALEKALKEHPLTGQDEILNDLAKRQMPDAQQLAAAKKAISDRADLVRLVHLAASRKQCVFAKDWSVENPADYETAFRYPMPAYLAPKKA